jgi:hypothetical protein
MSRKDGKALPKLTPPRWDRASAASAGNRERNVSFLDNRQRFVEFHTDALRFDTHYFTLDVDGVFAPG